MNISDLNISEIVDKAKDTLGLEPQEAEDGAYTPSKLRLNWQRLTKPTTIIASTKRHIGATKKS